MTSHSLLSFPLDPISSLCNPRASECCESNNPQSCANHSTPFVFPLTMALRSGCQHIASGAVDIIEEKWRIRKRGGKSRSGYMGDIKWLNKDRWQHIPRVMHKVQYRIALQLLFLCTPSVIVNELPVTLPLYSTFVCRVRQIVDNLLKLQAFTCTHAHFNNFMPYKLTRIQKEALFW